MDNPLGSVFRFVVSKYSLERVPESFDRIGAIREELSLPTFSLMFQEFFCCLSSGVRDKEAFPTRKIRAKSDERASESNA